MPGTEMFGLFMESASFITKMEISSSSFVARMESWRACSSASLEVVTVLSPCLVISCKAVVMALRMLWQAQSLAMAGFGMPSQVLFPMSPK